jgi:LysM repeat protein
MPFVGSLGVARRGAARPRDAAATVAAPSTTSITRRSAAPLIVLLILALTATATQLPLGDVATAEVAPAAAALPGVATARSADRVAVSSTDRSATAVSVTAADTARVAAPVLADAAFTADGRLVKPAIARIRVGGAVHDVQRHRTARGESLWSISRAYGIDTMTLWWANVDRLLGGLNVGTLLVIPPARGVLHAVVEGETLASIAATYRSTPQSIIDANAITGDVVVLRQLLLIPDGRGPSYPKGLLERRAAFEPDILSAGTGRVPFHGPTALFGADGFSFGAGTGADPVDHALLAAVRWTTAASSDRRSPAAARPDRGPRPAPAPELRSVAGAAPARAARTAASAMARRAADRRAGTRVPRSRAPKSRPSRPTDPRPRPTSRASRPSPRRRAAAGPARRSRAPASRRPHPRPLPARRPRPMAAPCPTDGRPVDGGTGPAGGDPDRVVTGEGEAPPPVDEGGREAIADEPWDLGASAELLESWGLDADHAHQDGASIAITNDDATRASRQLEAAAALEEARRDPPAGAEEPRPATPRIPREGDTGISPEDQTRIPPLDPKAARLAAAQLRADSIRFPGVGGATRPGQGDLPYSGEDVYGVPKRSQLLKWKGTPAEQGRGHQLAVVPGLGRPHLTAVHA